MDSLSKKLFGPLEECYYCNYFLVLSIFGFSLFIGSIMLFLFGLFDKKTNKKMFLKIIMVGMLYFVFYFQNRLLYTMCDKTVCK
jgi:asparagine N-glycosylation enzyme membrane subunit Stt3